MEVLKIIFMQDLCAFIGSLAAIAVAMWVIVLLERRHK